MNSPMGPPIIIQARTGSKRLPAKVLAELAGRTVLEYVIRRCQLNSVASAVIVVTSTLPPDDAVENLARNLGVAVFRGSEEDVLLRYVEAARQLDVAALVRITADCPLIDPDVIDKVVEMFVRHPCDYGHIRGYPVGLGDVEVLSMSALERSLSETAVEQSYYREHVMTYIVEHPEKFLIRIMAAPSEMMNTGIHLAVDEATDLDVVRQICEFFAPRIDFRSREILRFVEAHPDIAQMSRRRHGAS